ncbi:TRAP transporter substrate-binding protein [Shouchella clausii]|uniref:TRAP transporter substrate-binding protein n=1 Tax=Shouchella clausii TaxID=79880 RepID=UPI0039824B87
MRNLLTAIGFCVLLLGTLAGCQSAIGADNTVTLRLAHNLNEDHPVHKSLVEFQKKTDKKTDGTVKIQIYPNGQLGTEREVMELTQTGAVDFTKVSASSLENFAEVYSIFSLPYLFDDMDHYHRVMESDIVNEIYQSTRESGFIGLTYFDAGSRNFYTNHPIMHPDDLKGLKVRVQPSLTSIRMVELMGGAPTPMAYGELYTGLQQGVIDGAENAELNFLSSKHNEVAKQFSYSEHTIVPDILIMNVKTWNQLTEIQQTAVLEAAEESMEFHKNLWASETEKAIAELERMGVQFNRPDKTPFQEAVQLLHEEFAKKESTQKYYKQIRAEAK